jgi:hypothetical protein
VAGRWAAESSRLNDKQAAEKRALNRGCNNSRPARPTHIPKLPGKTPAGFEGRSTRVTSTRAIWSCRNARQKGADYGCHEALCAAVTGSCSLGPGRPGLTVLAVVALVITAARLLGLVLDGAAPFTVQVLKPEFALIVASATALIFERWRRLREADTAPLTRGP